MMNDTILLNEGMKYLSEKLGILEAERFIALVLREPFDYTKWRKNNLLPEMSVKEISKLAQQYCDANPNE